jgi:hypothetical protein
MLDEAVRVRIVSFLFASEARIRKFTFVFRANEAIKVNTSRLARPNRSANAVRTDREKK